jgi:hypothetical protein
MRGEIMEIIKIKNINELAQNFLKAHRVLENNNVLSITYDYEKGSGEYGEKSIYIKDTKGYRHVVESNITVDMINAYNSIGVVVDSDWISNELQFQDYKHYIIYFDEYGAYEIIAKEFQGA